METKKQNKTRTKQKNTKISENQDLNYFSLETLA